MATDAVPALARPHRPNRRRWLAAGTALFMVVGLVAADRLLLWLAERRLADRLACVGTLGGGVSVHLGGFPFLTEVASGHVSSVRVTAGHGGPDGKLADIAVDLRDLRLPPVTGLLRSDGGARLTIGAATLAATIPYGSARDLAGAVMRPGGITPRTDGTGTGTGAGGAVAAGLPFGAHLDGASVTPAGVRLSMSTTAVSFDGQPSGHAACGST